MVKLKESAFGDAIAIYSLKLDDCKDIDVCLLEASKQVISFLIEKVKEKQVKIILDLECEYYNPKVDESLTYNHISPIKTLLTTKDVPQFYSYACEKISTSSTEFETRKSGWVLVSCNRLFINLYKYEPLKGSGYIELPPLLKKSIK